MPIKFLNDVAVDSSVLYVDTINNRVGIGTTSPDSLLHVSADVTGANTGTITIEGRPTGFLGDDIATIDFHNSGSKRADIRMERGNAADDSQLVFSTSDTGTLNDALIINEIGNVGIGTTSPTRALDVSKSGSTILANFKNTGGTSSFISLGNTSSTADQIRLGSNGTALTLSTNYAERMRITSDGSVGIGTTSPSQKLHVVGNARVTGAYYDSNNSPGTTNQVLLSTVTGTDWVDGTAIPGLVDGTGTANYVARWIGTESIGTGVIYDNGTNVGINATSLYSKLHIGNSSNGNNNLLTMESSGSVWVHLKTPSSNQAQIGFGDTQFVNQNTRGRITYNSSTTAANNYMSFVTNFAEVMRITNSNVGIGTTSPAVKLHVGSTSTSGATTEEFRLQSGTSSGNGGTAIANLVTGNFGISGIYFGNNTTYSSQPAYLQYQRSSNVTTLKFDATFNIDQGSSGTRFNINSSGNVGIGTTNPTGKLEVRQAANNGNTGAFTNTHVKLTASATADNTGFVGITAATSTSDNYGYSFGAQRTSGGVGSFKINYHNGIAAGVNRFIIDQNGNVGIGTTSPQEKLDVNGDIAIKNATQLSFDSNNGTLSVASDAGQVNLLNSSIFINYSSNVGIGTTSPSKKLHVTGAAQVDNGGLLLGGTSNVDGNNPQLRRANSSNDLRIATAGSDRMTILGTGNVGIGITNPQTTLHMGVQGASTTGDKEFRLESTGSSGYGGNSIVNLRTGTYGTSGVYFGNQSTYTSQKARIEFSDFNGAIYYNVTSGGSNNYHYWQNAGSVKMTLKNSNLGIGTTSPSYQLQLSTNSAAKPTSSTWTVVSDKRVKTNIRPYETGLQELLQIEPKLFDYNGKAGFDTEAKNNIGVIAQEIKDIMPETVKKYNTKLNEEDEEDTELYNFDSHALTFALINSVKELNAKIESLESKIQALENK